MTNFKEYVEKSMKDFVDNVPRYYFEMAEHLYYEGLKKIIDKHNEIVDEIKSEKKKPGRPKKIKVIG